MAVVELIEANTISRGLRDASTKHKVSGIRETTIQQQPMCVEHTEACIPILSLHFEYLNAIAEVEIQILEGLSRTWLFLFL